MPVPNKEALQQPLKMLFKEGCAIDKYLVWVRRKANMYLQLLTSDQSTWNEDIRTSLEKIDVLPLQRETHPYRVSTTEQLSGAIVDLGSYLSRCGIGKDKKGEIEQFLENAGKKVIAHAGNVEIQISVGKNGFIS